MRFNAVVIFFNVKIVLNVGAKIKSQETAHEKFILKSTWVLPMVTAMKWPLLGLKMEGPKMNESMHNLWIRKLSFMS